MKNNVIFRIAALVIVACMIMSSCGTGANKPAETTGAVITDPVSGTEKPEESTSAEPIVDPSADIAIALGSSSISRTLYEGYLKMTWSTAAAMLSLFGIVTEEDLTGDKTLGEIKLSDEFASAGEMLGLDPGDSMLDFIRRQLDKSLRQMLVCAESAKREGVKVDDQILADAFAEADEAAKKQGYASYLELTQKMFGGISEEDVKNFFELSYLAEQYKSVIEDHKFSEEEISAFINGEEQSDMFEAPVYTVIHGERVAELRELLSKELEDEEQSIKDFIASLNGEGVETLHIADFTDPALLRLAYVDIPGAFAFGTEQDGDVFVRINDEREIRDSAMFDYYVLYANYDPSETVETIKALSTDEAVEYIKGIIKASSETDIDIDWGDDDETDGESSSDDEIPEVGDTTETSDESGEEPKAGEEPEVGEEPEAGEEEDDEPTLTGMEYTGVPDWRNPEIAKWLNSEERKAGDLLVLNLDGEYEIVYFTGKDGSFASSMMISDYVEEELEKLTEGVEFIYGEGFEEIDVPAKIDESVFEGLKGPEGDED